MEVSYFLARLFGLVLLVHGITFFLRANDLKGLAKEFKKNLALQLFGGMLAVVTGLFVIMVHNVWDTYWQSLVSLLGWLIFLKGILLLWSPEILEDLINDMEKPIFLHVSSLTMYTISIILLGYGFGFLV
jgi:hypothetical protein